MASVKRLVNVRLDPELVEQFDTWAAGRGWSRTRAIEQLIQRALAPKAPAEAPSKLGNTQVEPRFRST